MSISTQHYSVICFFILLLSPQTFFSLSKADVGTASHYDPPYLPTACKGRDVSQFPTNNLFGAAGEAVWDNGASCGRRYEVRCISTAKPWSCVRDNIIMIRIVDRAVTAPSRASRAGSTIVLSTTAFAAIANASASYVNIEYREV